MSNNIRPRLNRLHRFNMALCSAVLIILTGNVLFCSLSEELSEIFSPNPPQIISYKVGTGDTLWSIASKAVLPGEDIREKIIVMRRINGLSPNQVLMPGQAVQVPVKRIEDTGFRYTLKTP